MTFANSGSPLQSASAHREGGAADVGASAQEGQPKGQMVTPFRKTVRARNKSHLVFVAAQPCLICQRSPSDAHHLKFAHSGALGRKVSVEFTVPLCRDHHQELHRPAMNWPGGQISTWSHWRRQKAYGRSQCLGVARWLM